MRKPTKQDLPDSQLLRLSQRGDEEAFVLLYRRHQAPIFRFAWHMSGRRELAEEVTQEVFFSLLSQRNSYVEQRGAFQGYLIGIARNQVRNQLARERVRVPDLLDEGDRGQLVDSLSVDQEVEGLRRAILSLPAQYREVVVLCELENLDYATVAEQLGCAIGTVRSRLHRARALLGAKLQKGAKCPV